MPLDLPTDADRTIVAATEAWLERIVIGLNLCPFARSAHANRQIRYAVSHARSTGALLDTLERELALLASTHADAIETTLLVHPDVLDDFLAYNDFLDEADAAVERLALTGEIQIASFHPDYRFAGAQADDVANYTNRSPFPMLNLLREASVERAIASMPGVAEIPARNIDTLRRLGQEGLRRLSSTSHEGPTRH